MKGIKILEKRFIAAVASGTLILQIFSLSATVGDLLQVVSPDDDGTKIIILRNEI